MDPRCSFLWLPSFFSKPKAPPVSVTPRNVGVKSQRGPRLIKLVSTRCFSDPPESLAVGACCLPHHPRTSPRESFANRWSRPLNLFQDFLAPQGCTCEDVEHNLNQTTRCVQGGSCMVFHDSTVPVCGLLWEPVGKTSLPTKIPPG